MSDELKPPILLQPIPKQQVAVGTPFRLDLAEYVQNSITEKESFGEDVANGLLYSVEAEGSEHLPPDLDYTITGEVYGQLRKEALDHSPYRLNVTVSNGSDEPLETSFELEVLPALNETDEWSVDESLTDEFSDEVTLSEEEELELFKTLKDETKKSESQFTEEKQAVWQAILQGQTVPEIQALMDRPITHQEIYYLLGRMAYFVIWDAHNSAPAGPLSPLHLQGVGEHFNIYDRGSCIVATPKHLFDHNRTLLHAVKVSQAMAQEVFKRGWTVEFGGFDKMVRAAWVEFEILSEKYEKPVKYSYFNPSPHDVDTLIQAKSVRLS